MEAVTIPGRHERQRTVDEFTVTDRRVLSDAWRHESVDGHAVAHAAPAPGRGAVHVCRARPGGSDGVLRLGSTGVAVPLAEAYASVPLPRGPASEASTA